MAIQPTRDDKFSFGLWTVGWQARDPFGDATRPPLDPVEAVHRLAELGAYGVTFHDDDLFPSAAPRADRQREIDRFKGALDETGMIVPMVTTNLFTHPVFKDGGFTSNDRARAPLRAAQGAAQHRPRRRARREDLRASGAAARAPSTTPPRTSAPRSTATARPSTCSPSTSSTRATTSGSRIEPKPNEPRGDILLPTVGHALAFIDTLEHPEHGRPQPRGRPRADGRAELRRTASPRRCGTASCSTSTSTASAASSTTRTWSSATATCSTRSPWSTCWRTAAPTAARPTTGPRHFDYKPLAHRGHRPASGPRPPPTCATYLLLKERAAAFRADPEVQEALAAARSPSSPTPTLARARRYADLLADRVRVRGLRRRRRTRRQGLRLRAAHQLALEHLLGAR